MKTTVRVVALVLAALLALGMFSGIFAMFAFASVGSSTPDPVYYPIIVTADTTMSATVTTGKTRTNLTIKFKFTPGQSDYEYDDEIPFGDFSIPADSSFSFGEKTKLRVQRSSSENDYYIATLSGVTYNGGSGKTLILDVDTGDYATTFTVPVPSKYFRAESTDESDPLRSELVIESVTVRDASNQKLDLVDKDTPPFTVEIEYYDIGIEGADLNELSKENFHAFLRTSSGFKALGGTVGTLTLVSTKAQFPRFRATFKNIKADATADILNFKVQYDIDGTSVRSDGSAQIIQIEKDEDNGDAAPLRPNMIVQAYSYGDEPIIAGDDFNLDFTLANTSRSVAVENVVMTIEPNNGFIIAAASNTVYFEELQPGATVPYSIALRPVPTGNSTTETTDYSIVVRFKYQYMSKKEYAEGGSEVRIAIPVAQLDRFAVDEITDYSMYLTVGEEGYVSVPITNKGKSLTYNITGTIREQGSAGMEFIAPSVHYGNLEAGKSGTVDLALTVNMPGEFHGEAIIQYEDENMRQKELKVSFSTMVAEASMPPPEIPPDAEQNMEPQGSKWFVVVCCIAGGLLMAVPIALYIIKRVRAKGSEDIDEDF